MNPRAYRLPTHVLPRRYDVAIDARPGREAFHGRLRVALDLREASRTVEMHARDLAVSDVTLASGGVEQPGEVAIDAVRETVTFTFAKPAPRGDAVLELAFSGRVRQGLKGLYVARDGPESALATQAQEVDARSIFPCFDEPAFKASVGWTVTTSPDVVVLTNGKLKEKKARADGVTWTFEPTRPIASYLAAMVIGEFASMPERVVNGVPLRVWALRGKEPMGAFAQDFTAELLPWFEDYFGVPYPYGKYDQVAVPGFAAGAMENVGLVTFRQIYLLVDPRTASWRSYKHVARVVAHEFAHMWFGNLVTMQWWDDIWLNESFAEWVAYKAVHALRPDYRMWDMQQGFRLAALANDALESTHSIYTPAETPEQAVELFDSITYDKGAGTMRMLEGFLGEDAFRAGLRTYMQEFAEKNAVRADLWRHLAAASGRPVERVMGAWITQPGHPVVRVESASGGRLRLSQRRFLYSPRPKAEVDATWPVPLIVRYEDDAGVHVARHLLEEREGELALPVRGAVKWVYANAHASGVYRVDPDDATLAALLAHRAALAPTEQASLVDDQWGLARNGTRPLTQFLDVLAEIARTEDYAVAERVVEHLRALEDMLLEADDAQALAAFRAWVGRLVEAPLAALGMDARDGEPPEDGQRRAALLEAAAALARRPDAVAACRRLADREAEDPGAVDPSLAAVAVHVAAKLGDAARFEKHLAVYRARREAGASPQDTERYLTSLIAFEQPELVARVIRLMDEKVLPTESWGPLIRAMLRLRHAQVATWEHLKANFKGVRSAMGDMWIGFFVAATGALPPRLRDDMVRFYDQALAGGLAQQNYRRALDDLDQRAEFRARTRGELVAWFREKA